jgi:hypothetical protein
VCQRVDAPPVPDPGGASSRLTRPVVAVEQLVVAVETITKTVADHEKRLAKGGL